MALRRAARQNSRVAAVNAIPPGLPAAYAADAGAPSAVHHPLIGSCLLDRDLHLLSLSQNLAAMPGSPLTAHLGHSVADALPALFAAVGQVLQGALAGVAAEGIEIRGDLLSPVATGRSFVMSVQPM